MNTNNHSHLYILFLTDDDTLLRSFILNILCHIMKFKYLFDYFDANANIMMPHIRNTSNFGTQYDWKSMYVRCVTQVWLISPHMRLTCVCIDTEIQELISFSFINVIALISMFVIIFPYLYINLFRYATCH